MKRLLLPRVDEPIDYRPLEGKPKPWQKEDHIYLDFTRQVFPSGKGDEIEFDDEAIQMHIRLGYGPPASDIRSSYLWIESPDTIDRGVQQFKNIPFVADWVLKKPVRVHVCVEHCG